jgi:glucose-1-phosphate adenylyltransferase
MKQVLAIILGGGAGTRLYPLTKSRAKPAVSLAGKYRLIDIPISNCINAKISKIYVLTQFNSASLNRHISRTYSFPPISGGFTEVLAAQQTQEASDWFQGTADAVRQYSWLFQEWSNVEEILILSGDHLYRMDYSQFIQRHRETQADITLSVVPIDASRASSFGLMKIDGQGRVVAFAEKPQGPALEAMAVDTTSLGLTPEIAQEKRFIASMGIYVFKRQVLFDLLETMAEATDFGKEVIPAAAQTHNVQAYLFQGYWEDIGTIESFYQANLALTRQPDPDFSFYDPDAPIYTRSRYLPPSKLLNCRITESMVGEGCILKDCQVHQSVLGLRTRIGPGSVVDKTLIIGADYYSDTLEGQGHTVPVGIGRDCRITKAILDKNARIGDHVQIINKDHVQEAEREDLGFYIRSGIVVVFRNAVISDGTVI